jgi:DNA mismatch endonuclease (patch repair protein)
VPGFKGSFQPQAKGHRYRKNVKELLGCPDILFKSKKIVVFVDGKFWHGYNWHEDSEW